MEFIGSFLQIMPVIAPSAAPSVELVSGEA